MYHQLCRFFDILNYVQYKVSITNDVEIRVPNVKGKSLGEAVRLIKEKLLNVSVRELRDGACINGVDSVMAIVHRQSPECGSDIKLGREVSLFYSCDSTRKVSNKKREERRHKQVP